MEWSEHEQRGKGNPERYNRIECGPQMVFNIMGIAAPPCKTNSPLFIDPYAVLYLPLSMQFLQTVVRKHAQCIKDSLLPKE
jgi:hypothetical protein